jgi:hypothetical protein
VFNSTLDFGAMTMPHKCPVRDCEKQVGDVFLMCPRHWRMVPKELQTEVYRTFRYMSDDEGKSGARGSMRDLIEAYREARRAAIEAVEKAGKG